MKFYADSPGRRARQLGTDLALVTWTLLWARLGMWIDELVSRLAGPGRAVERAGSGLARPLDEAAREVAGLPLVGEALGAPLEAAADAGRALAAAGAGQQDVVHTLALWLGTLFAVMPVSLALALYLPGRLRWAREATAARRLCRSAPSLELFALRAVATRPLAELYRASPDPAAALRSGDLRGLAALELRSLGLEPPSAPESAG
jgi:hypothetical protein